MKFSIFRTLSKLEFVKLKRFRNVYSYKGYCFDLKMYRYPEGWETLGDIRIGIVASKRLGKAVIRNLAKRRLRNALIYIGKERELSDKFIYLFFIKSAIVNVKFSELLEELRQTLRIANNNREEV